MLKFSVMTLNFSEIHWWFASCSSCAILPLKHRLFEWMFVMNIHASGNPQIMMAYISQVSLCPSGSWNAFFWKNMCSVMMVTLTSQTLFSAHCVWSLLPKSWYVIAFYRDLSSLSCCGLPVTFCCWPGLQPTTYLQPLERRDQNHSPLVPFCLCLTHIHT